MGKVASMGVDMTSPPPEAAAPLRHQSPWGPRGRSAQLGRVLGRGASLKLPGQVLRLPKYNLRGRVPKPITKSKVSMPGAG